MRNWRRNAAQNRPRLRRAIGSLTSVRGTGAGNVGTRAWREVTALNSSLTGFLFKFAQLGDGVSDVRDTLLQTSPLLFLLFTFRSLQGLNRARIHVDYAFQARLLLLNNS